MFEPNNLIVYYFVIVIMTGLLEHSKLAAGWKAVAHGFLYTAIAYAVRTYGVTT